MLTIRKGGHVDLERLYSAMEIDFDRKELLGKWSIHKALCRPAIRSCWSFPTGNPASTRATRWS